jgi:hypothetical protein
VKLEIVEDGCTSRVSSYLLFDFSSSVFFFLLIFKNNFVFSNLCVCLFVLLFGFFPSVCFFLLMFKNIFVFSSLSVCFCLFYLVFFLLSVILL